MTHCCEVRADMFQGARSAAEAAEEADGAAESGRGVAGWAGQGTELWRARRSCRPRRVDAPGQQDGGQPWARSDLMYTLGVCVELRLLAGAGLWKDINTLLTT